MRPFWSATCTCTVNEDFLVRMVQVTTVPTGSDCTAVPHVAELSPAAVAISEARTRGNVDRAVKVDPAPIATRYGIGLVPNGTRHWITNPGVVFVGAAHDGLPTVTPRRVPSIRAWAFAAAATSFTETASGGPLITSIVVGVALDFDFFARACGGENTNPKAAMALTATPRDVHRRKTFGRRTRPDEVRRPSCTPPV
jgi:hypothetical protein